MKTKNTAEITKWFYELGITHHSYCIGGKDKPDDTIDKTEDDSSTQPTTTQEFDELLQEYFYFVL